MYGRFYLPTARLDALYSTRLSTTLQAMVAAISDPPSNIPTELRRRNTNVNNIMVSLQHDVGKCCTEYNYSAEDSMWGVRFLYNFGRLGISPEPTEEAQSQVKIKRVDAEDAVGGGLRGRVSVGAELYFSAKEKSAGGRSAILVGPILFSHLFHSLNWSTIHDPSRCNSAICTTALVIFVNPTFTFTYPSINLSTPDYSHLSLQPNVRTCIGCLHRENIARSCILDTIRFQCV